MSKYHDFKIGDKVKIVKIVKRIEKEGLKGRWNANGKMDWTLGKIGEIIEIFDNYILKVSLENCNEIWDYHYECLQKITDKKVKKNKKELSILDREEAISNIFKIPNFKIPNFKIPNFKIPNFDISGIIINSWNKNLKEDKMTITKILNLYSVYVVNKNTEEILVDKRTVIGSNKTEIECSVRDELIRKNKDLKSSSLIFKIETITSWEAEIEK